MNNKGPNDLDVIIEKLKKENYKLKMEIEMLKKDITFLRQEYRDRALEYRDWETDRKSTRLNSSHRL